MYVEYENERTERDQGEFARFTEIPARLHASF